MVTMIGLGLVSPAYAQAQGQLFGTEEQGYGRLILSFPSIDALPPYQFRVDNNVVSITFDQKVDIVLPDLAAAMPNYMTVARLDGDGKGLRLGLKSAFTFNRADAGNQLYVDLMPSTWQGMPPALPDDVVARIAENERVKALQAERERKAREMADLDPRVDLRIGRNPGFLRLQFNWNVPTASSFTKKGNVGALDFEWPVGVDLSALKSDLPAEIVSADAGTSPDGAVVSMIFAEGVTPRFYEVGPNQQVLDIDLGSHGLPELKPEDLAAEAAAASAAHEAEQEGAEPDTAALNAAPAKSITPLVSVLGSTVRLVFPFEQDTPSAVFRRGDTLWMVFDTVSGIQPPVPSPEFDSVAAGFSVIASGDTQIVRIDLTRDRLATLGSQGMAWVLSLGDMMLSPTEPMSLNRRRTLDGSFEMVADVVRPGRIHDFRDPLVGDTLKIVTAFPPARGVTRTLDYVDFTALRSVHGLVIKPKSDALDVALDSTNAVMSTNSGLTVSALDTLRNVGTEAQEAARAGYVDLGSLQQPDPEKFLEHRDEIEQAAASGEGRERDKARLELAQYYTANQYAFEALGVLRVLNADLKAQDLTRAIRSTEAIANVLAERPRDALQILNATSLEQDIDALFWRTIARTENHDYKGGRLDAIEARGIVDSYPTWARNLFRLSAARSAVEDGDPTTAQRMLDDIDFSTLGVEDTSLYQLLSGRIDEAEGRNDEAMDTYGQVITAEIRPTRAEAVYRTLLLLDKEGRLDLNKATTTLAAEAMLWRGDALEADMQTLLAQLYFRNGEYRLGFETVKSAVANYPESPPVNTLRDQAQAMFSDLFLNGVADSISPVEALGIYYDFRHLTPPGAKGDEMIRNLARRLVKVDLLPQAAELLKYQLDNRLRGVAKTQIAADLAVIYLADRQPNEAIRVLNDTRLPDIAESLERQRRILEARALIDGGRDQLALDLVRTMDGKDVELLRIDANWKAKRYSQAGEMIEALYANEPEGKPLDRATRMNLIKAAVGYVLANDTTGLSRLRAKYGEPLVSSPEWPMFDFVTGPIQTSSLEFKKVAAEVAALDSLDSFLASYRETYGADGALTPTKGATGSSDVASAK